MVEKNTDGSRLEAFQSEVDAVCTRRTTGDKDSIVEPVNLRELEIAVRLMIPQGTLYDPRKSVPSEYLREHGIQLSAVTDSSDRYVGNWKPTGEDADGSTEWTPVSLADHISELYQSNKGDIGDSDVSANDLLREQYSTVGLLSKPSGDQGIQPGEIAQSLSNIATSLCNAQPFNG